MSGLAGNIASALVQPRDHELSLALAREAETWILPREGSQAIKNCRVVAEGIVEMNLQAGSLQGYGARPWTIRIGGIGYGDEPELAAALGTAPRPPVSVRFTCPFFSCPGVDDAGMCDASLLDGLGPTPSLVQIGERVAAWLRGPPRPLPGTTAAAAAADEEEDGDRKRESDWLAAEAHTMGKQQVIDAFRQGWAADLKLVGEDVVLCREWFAPALRPLIGCGSLAERMAACEALLAPGGGSGGEMPPVFEELAEGSGIYAFDLLTTEFCARLLGEVDRFESTDLPRRRPNTMNRSGLVVNEIGFESLMSALMEAVIKPLSALLYPSERFASSLDHHHSFVVQYSVAEAGIQKGLDMHHDASEVTLNVCLGRTFEAAGLRFCGRFGGADHRALRCTHAHKVGRAILHLGRQRHGADDITAGERLNLIVWARSSAFRSAAAFGFVPPDGYPQQQESSQPERFCLSKSNDRDYEQQLAALGEVPCSTAGEQRERGAGAAAVGSSSTLKRAGDDAIAMAFAGAMPAAKCVRVKK